MNIFEGLVVSLEASKKLKELGCPQDSRFFWYRGQSNLPNSSPDWFVGNIGVDNVILHFDRQKNVQHFRQEIKYLGDDIAAYTFNDLIKLLPTNLEEYKLFVVSSGSTWGISYDDGKGKKFGDKLFVAGGSDLVDIMAKMLICLIESGYIVVPNRF